MERSSRPYACRDLCLVCSRYRLQCFQPPGLCRHHASFAMSVPQKSRFVKSAQNSDVQVITESAPARVRSVDNAMALETSPARADSLCTAVPAKIPVYDSRRARRLTLVPKRTVVDPAAKLVTAPADGTSLRLEPCRRHANNHTSCRQEQA